MSQQQIVEKITHLEAQLQRLEQLEFGVRNTLAIAGYFNKRIARYREAAQNCVYHQPIPA